MNDSTPCDTLDPAEVFEGELDAGTLKRLSDDLARCTQILKIQAKYHAQVQVRHDALTLAEGLGLLENGALRGLQIIYRYQNEIWCDTIMVVRQAVRLVRIKHEV